MKNLLKFLAFAAIGFFAIASCDKEDPQIIVDPITLPADIEELGSFWGNGSSDVEHVLINTQGGPVPELLDSELRAILKDVDDSKTEDLLIFNVHQAQTKSPGEFQQNITFEEAKAFDQESVADLAKVIKYFKSIDKKVHVLGISFGAFMTQELINKEGANIADDYLIMVGRLDMPAVIWESFAEGNAGGFEDGTMPFAEALNGEPIEKNMSRLAAGLGHKRYTEELKNTDLSKVTYVYGDLDEQVGRLANEEIDFLKNQGATVLRVENEDHSGAIDGAINQSFGMAFDLD